MRTDAKAPIDPRATRVFQQGAKAFESFTTDELAKLTEYVARVKAAAAAS